MTSPTRRAPPRLCSARHGRRGAKRRVRHHRRPRSSHVSAVSVCRSSEFSRESVAGISCDSGALALPSPATPHSARWCGPPAGAAPLAKSNCKQATFLRSLFVVKSLSLPQCGCAAMGAALLAAALLRATASATVPSKWSSGVSLANCDVANPHQIWVSSWSGEFRDQVSGRCLTPTSTVLETEGNSVVVDECDSKIEHLQEWDYEKDDGQGNHNVLKLKDPLARCPGPWGGSGCCLDTDLSASGIVQLYVCHGSTQPERKNQIFKRVGQMFQVEPTPGEVQCSSPPCCLTAAAPPPGCFEAGVCRKITGVWGLILLLGFAAGLIVYSVGGVGYAYHVHGKPATIGSHPHVERWADARALIVDGVRFTRMWVSSDKEGGSSYKQVPSSCLAPPSVSDLSGGMKVGKKEKREKKEKKRSSSKRRSEAEESVVLPEAPVEREWKPTPRANLSSGARETGVKVRF